MTPISDTSAYAKALTYTMDEKLFFLDRLRDVSTWVDYGCADGRLLREVVKRTPQPVATVGFDNDTRWAKHGAVSSWNSVRSALRYLRAHFVPLEQADKTAIIFSSVLHEVFTGPHWGFLDLEFPKKKAQWLIDTADDAHADYIVIRDMMVPAHVGSEWRRQIEEFLKEPYRDGPDWERERQEEYLSVPPNFGELVEQASGGTFKLVFERRYIPLAVWERWPKGLGVTTTHVQMILKRTNE